MTQWCDLLPGRAAQGTRVNKREMIGPSGITNNETLKVVVREKSVGEICAFNNIAQRLKIVITYKP